MLYSIITASYNSEKTIAKTIESVLNQTYSNFEYIIIDGKSSDATVEIIKSFEKEFENKSINYTWISEPDNGIYDAWNKGLKLASGDWISFLGSDDFYLLNALELYNTEIEKELSINFISSKVDLINSDEKSIQIVGKKYNQEKMKRFMVIAHVGSFHHKSLFAEFGNFNTSLKIAGDYNFFLKSEKKIKAGFVNEITVKMLNDGISNQNVNLAFKENLQLHLQYKRIPKIQAYFEFYLAKIKYKLKHL